jgi:predicted Zn-dependent peptidase
MYKETRLKNGAIIVKSPIKGFESVTLLALFKTGSRDEKGTAEGMAHFLEHMLLKGSTKRPSGAAINKDLNSVGAYNNAFTAKEYTGFWIKCARKDVELALDILSDIIINPLLNQKDIDTEKGPILEEIKMYEDAPMRDIPSVFEQLLFNGHNLAHDQLGPEENVRNFSRKSLVSFYKKHYRANNMLLAITGNFDENSIDKKVKKYFSAVCGESGEIKRTRFSCRQTKPEVFIKYKKTDQTNLSLGFRALPTGHKDEYVLDVLNIILGGNDSSRLFETVREREGLAYYIYSYTCDYQDAGYIAIQSGVGNDRCEQTIALIMEEIRRIKESGITKEELERAKSYVEGKMAISLESSSSLADFIAIQKITTGKILTPKEKFDKINAITKQDVERIAREIFTEQKLNLALIGPFKNKKAFERLLNI